MARPTDPVAFHSEIASAFHESYSRDANRAERLAVWRSVFDRHLPQRASFAYDVGCGSGMITCEIAARSDSVIAIDGSPAMLEIARKTLAGRDLTNVAFHESRLPIADTSSMAKAPVVVSSSVIEYLDSIEEAFRFLRSLAAPGALVVFSVSNKHSLSRRLVRLFHRLTGRPRYFGLVKHFLGMDDVRRLAAASGLDVVEQIYFGGQDRLNRVFSVFLPQAASTNMLLVVARAKE